jgi:two-component system CheB/CheR fusion protein
MPQSQQLTIIGVGASAGGLEALENLFKNLSPSENVCFVVIQHLSPDYKSMMVELLGKHTKIPVQHASDKLQVKGGNIYLIPPKKNIRIQNKILQLEDIHHSPGSINLPIDTFFISLAEDQGDKAVAVVLSGTGSDGTRGLRKIKEKGGTVLVQEESDAKFDGMPKSAIATGLVDYVLPVDKMGKVLSDFLDHPLASKPVDSSSFEDRDSYESVMQAVQKYSGINFSLYKKATVTRRIARRMSLNQVDTLAEYMHFIDSNPREIEVLHRELLIGVTNFFRDPEAFETLKKEVIPKILEGKQKREQVRIWVSSCSTGEEAYSIAILFKEYMKENGLRTDVKIFATDVDSFALKQAGTGLYSDSIAADVSPDRLNQFFIKKGNVYQVSPEIREMVIFAPQNLLKDPPFSRIDLISCRNLLIYLQSEAQRKILYTFHFSLVPGGFLFLGSSESLGELSSYFSDVHTKWKIFKSKTDALPFNLGTISSDISTKTYKTIYSGNYGTKAIKEEKVFDRLFSKILENYLPPCVIVNEHYQILHVIGNVNPYIKMQSGKINFDITAMVDKNVKIALTTGLRKCFQENKEVLYKNISIQENLEKSYINLIIQPVNPTDLSSRMVLVIFEDVSVIQRKRHDGEEFNLDENSARRITELEQELEFNRENLQATIEQLETSNEELQATNEELLAANEELQSTNEELQSVNEELITLNSEHQSKIMELMELNNDISNLLANTDIGVIFLDRTMNIRKFTTAAQKMINLMKNDRGRPISHISHKFSGNISLHDESTQVLETLVPIEREMSSIDENGEETYYLLRFMPYRTIDNQIQGVVISIIDISALKRAENIVMKKDRFKSDILENIRESIITVDKNYQITSWNLYSESIFGYTELDAIGKNYFRLLFPAYSNEHIAEFTREIQASEHITGHSRATLKNGNEINIYSIHDLVHDREGKQDNIIIITRLI